MRNALMEDVVSEYNETDMTGVPTDPDNIDTSVETSTDDSSAVVIDEGATPADAVVENVPMEQTMRARVAVFEAILDEVVEDAVENPEPGEAPLTQEEATDLVTDVTDKAIEYDIVPPTARARASAIIKRHFAHYDPRVKLLSKAARFVADELTEVNDNAVELSPIVDEGILTDAEKGKVADAQEGEVIFDDQSEVASGGGEGVMRYRTPRARMRRKSHQYLPGFMSDDNGSVIEEILDPMSEGGKEIGDHVDDGPLELEGSSPTSEGGPSMAARYRRAMRYRNRMADDNDVTIDEVLDPMTNGGKDIGDHVDEGPLELEGCSPTSEGGAVMRRRMRARRSWRRMEEIGMPLPEETMPPEVEEQVVDPDYDVSSENVENATAEAAMRFLAASVVNQRKSTAMVSRAFSSALYRRMSHELRHILPRRFVTKYRIR